MVRTSSGSKLVFLKVLTANDTGERGSHQSGIHVPRRAWEMPGLLPPLASGVKNPEAVVIVRDENSREWKFRYVFYNNALHEPRGTRREHRITQMSRFFRESRARAGDTLILARQPGADFLEIRIVPGSKSAGSRSVGSGQIPLPEICETKAPVRVRPSVRGRSKVAKRPSKPSRK